jgi:lysophospholipase L1-like esterase
MIAGDSVVMGEGVLDEETYARLLERELSETHPGRRFEVLNVGLSGLALSHVLSRIEVLAPPFHPHLVVYGWTINDIEGPEYRANGPLASFQARYDRFESSQSYLLRALWPRWVSIEDSISPSEGSYPYDLWYNYFENDAAWRVFPEGFTRLAKLGATHGFCVHVFLHTQLFGLRFAHPFKPIYERVGQAAIDQGLSVTNSFPVFAGRKEWMLTLAPDDPHPNAAGHSLLAQALADGLSRLPQRCWGENSASAPSR